MPALREVQETFRVALLGGGDAVALGLIAGDDAARAARFGVYRNNVAVSLADVLAATFPAVRRLVGEGFFAYAGSQFIAAHPPRRACLAEYGADFAGFLASFPPCRDLSYLPDVARLEWLVNAAAAAADAPRAAPQDLAAVTAEDAPRIVFALDPALGYLESPFPIERIWRENRECGGGTVSLDEGGVRLEIGRGGAGIFVRALGAGAFAFRAALATGLDLEDAVARALSAAPGFDPAGALADLFRDGAVSAVVLPSPMQGCHP